MSSQLTSDECQRIQRANNSDDSYQMVTDISTSRAVLDDWTSSGDDSGIPLDAPDSQTEVINSDLIVAGSTSHLGMLPKLEAMPEQLKKERGKISELQSKVRRLIGQNADPKKRAEVFSSKKDGEMKRVQERDTEHKAKRECHLQRLSEETADLKRKYEELLIEKNGEMKRLRKELGDSRRAHKKVRERLEVLRRDNIELVRRGNVMSRELKLVRKKFDEMLTEEQSGVETMRLKVEDPEKQSQLKIGNCEMKRMRRELADCQCENTKMRKELEAVLKANVEMLMLRRVNNNVELTPERKEIEELLKKKDSELEVMRLEVEKERLKYLQLEMELKCIKKTTEKEEAEKKRVEELVREADLILSDATRGYNTLKIETMVYEMEEADAIEAMAAVESREEHAKVEEVSEHKLVEAVRILSSLESSNRSLMEWTEEASLRILREDEEMLYGESMGNEETEDKEEGGEGEETEVREERREMVDKEESEGKKDKEEGEETEVREESMEMVDKGDTDGKKVEEETEETEVREESMERVDEGGSGETPVNGHVEVLQEVKEVLVVDLGPSPLILEVDEEMEYREIVSTEETEDRKDTGETINFINGHDEAVQEVAEVIVIDPDDSMPEIGKAVRHPRVLFPSGEIPPVEGAPVTEENGEEHKKRRIRPVGNGYATQVFKQHLGVNYLVGVKRRQMHNNKVNASAVPRPSSKVVKAKTRGAKSRKQK